MTEPKQQILFVDDDVVLKDEIALLLSHYTFCGCETILEAVALAKRNLFSLYVLNVSLADGSGFSLCQKLRSLDLNTPILVTSVHDSESYRLYAQQVGAQAFWHKKEELNRLKTLMETCLRESKERSFEAKRAEFEAIRNELARQRAEAQALQAEARKLKAECQEKRIMLAASRAFESVGGSRADFSFLWPEVRAASLLD
jgi:DNA-binding response OmpR family regulator